MSITHFNQATGPSAVTEAAPAPLLVVRGVTKEFPGVRAVNAADFELYPGEVVALLGQNGAGKSTLIKILAGVHPHGSYSGSISMNGEPFVANSVLESEASGIALVPQELDVVPELTVAENMFLNTEPQRFGFVARAERHARAARVLSTFDISIAPDARMGDLDLVTQQLVVIARALSKNAKVLILDEPTAALTEHEVVRLFAQVRSLCARGMACIYVSHRLAEVFAIAQRIVVMRDGRVTGEHRVLETTRETIVNEMVGGAELARPEEAELKSDVSSLALEVSDFKVTAPGGRPLIEHLSFSVKKGEILGLFGLLGAGCAEMLKAVFGVWHGGSEGQVHVHGQAVQIQGAPDAIAARIGMMTQDRRDALLYEHSIAYNIMLACLSRLSNERGFLKPGVARRLAEDYVQMLNIKTVSVDRMVGTLSGGNQQKVHIARWLASGCDVLLLIDPTRGVDVGARAEISQLWRKLASQGYSIVVTSSEAEELVEICHRVVVVHGGRRGAEFTGAEITEDNLLRAAAGF